MTYGWKEKRIYYYLMKKVYRYKYNKFIFLDELIVSSEGELECNIKAGTLNKLIERLTSENKNGIYINF